MAASSRWRGLHFLNAAFVCWTRPSSADRTEKLRSRPRIRSCRVVGRVLRPVGEAGDPVGELSRPEKLRRRPDKLAARLDFGVSRGHSGVFRVRVSVYPARKTRFRLGFRVFRVCISVLPGVERVFRGVLRVYRPDFEFFRLPACHPGRLLHGYVLRGRHRPTGFGAPHAGGRPCLFRHLLRIDYRP